jgi:hypothetical protein
MAVECVGWQRAGWKPALPSVQCCAIYEKPPRQKFDGAVKVSIVRGVG